MGKSSKKGRLTGAQRKQMNKDIVSAVMEEETEDLIFGKVLRHLGNGHVSVMIPAIHPDGSMSLRKEGIAKIKTALSRRGSTPIAADDIVILSGRDFETTAKENPHLDLIGILTRGEAAKLEKEGRIQSWMMQSGEKIDETAVSDDIFDYTQSSDSSPADSKRNHTDNNNTDDIDIDKI
jgi:hypothetical protein